MTPKTIKTTILLLTALITVAVAPTASADDGGKCNPDTIDVNCTYEYNGEEYGCTLWYLQCYGDVLPEINSVQQ